MDIWERIDKMPLKNRQMILIVVTAIIMTGVIYVWYRSFENSLAGSFQVENKTEEDTVSEQSETGGSLFDLFGDIDIDWSRFKDLKEKIMQ